MARTKSKKADIEQAAMELFASKGFDGTTIKDIARKAVVTEGALYRHYESKEQMATVLFEHELSDIVLTLLEAMGTNVTPVGKLRAVIETLYRRYQEQPWPLLFVLLNFQNLKGNDILFQKNSLYDFIISHTTQLMGASKHSELNCELLPTILNGMVVQPIIYHYHAKLPRQPLVYVNEVVLNCCKLMELPYE